MIKPVNNSTFVEEKQCQSYFGSIENSVSFFESVHLLDVVHEISAGNILHYKVESIRRLASGSILYSSCLSYLPGMYIEDTLEKAVCLEAQERVSRTLHIRHRHL